MPDYSAQLRSGDVRWLARAITSVVEHAPEAEALLRAALPLTGHAAVVGLTGAPGSGKSTLADALARAYRAAGETLGIVAVDPTSPFSGGAILGDRIRMQAHHGDPAIFIRSLATRGALGGLAASAADVVTLLDAAGKDRILIETVGVGQDEVDIVKLADVTVVVLVPGMGDGVQALKAGIMEIADIFVINKADRGPERLEQEIRSMLALSASTHRAENAWRPPIVRTVATDGTGIGDLQAAIAARLAWMQSHGGLDHFRALQWQQRLRQFARERLADRLLAPLLDDLRLQALAESVARHQTDPFAAVDGLIRQALAGSAAPALDHLGIAVRDLDLACSRYALLGLVAGSREEVPHERVRVAMLPLASGRLELLEPTAPDSPIAKFLERRGEGLHHLALRVPDLAAALARLRAAGARLVNDNPQLGAGGHRYVFVHPSSVGGVLLELIEDHE